MNPIILDGPAVEPVSLGDAKLFLRLDGTAEDDLVSALLVAARITVEAATRLALIDQTWRLRLRALPGDGIVPLPLAPVRAVEAVRLADGHGGTSLLGADRWTLDGSADPARLLVAAGIGAGQAAEIDLLCGFGAVPDAVPRPLRLAILSLAARSFERRGDEPDGEGMPVAVQAMLAPFARRRLG